MEEEVVVTREQVVEALGKVVDPELFIDVWTLGLIYNIAIDGDAVDIRMTFTSIACPAGPQLVEDVRTKVGAVPGVDSVKVQVVFQPPWEPSEDLKAMLGI